jgi:hypothetical protein
MQLMTFHEVNTRIDQPMGIFLPFLSVFRPGFGCNTAPLKIIKDWKKAIDFNRYTQSVLSFSKFILKYHLCQWLC